MYRRTIAVLAILALALAMVAGCGQTTQTPLAATPAPKEAPKAPAPAAPATPAKEQVVRINIGTDPKALDPGITTGVPEATVEQHLFEGLMRLDKDARPVPGLAVAMPEVKDNGTTFVFKLRDAKWSNGDPITADDFVWSWQRVLDPRTGSQYAYQLYYIKGGEELNSIAMNQKGPDGKELKGADGKAVPRSAADIKADVDRLSKDLGVKAIDAKTLEVKLKAATPYFPSVAAFHTLAPVHRKTVEANPTDWFRKPETMVNSGPFKLTSWRPKDKVILEKNPTYYDAAKIKLSRIEFFLIDQESTATQMYETGQIDMLQSGINTKEIDRLKKERPNELLTLPDLGTYYYMFNVTKKPLDNAKVRRALTMAIDRKSIVEGITKGGQLPAMSYVPGGLPDVQGDFRKNGGDYFKDNDVAGAKKLLEEAGYPDGKGFPKVSILYNTSEAHKRIAEAIQQMWKKNLNVDVELSSQEWGVYLDSRTKLNYDIARAGWLGDYADPMTFIDMYVTGGGNNGTGWSNKTYDDLVKQANGTGDQNVRMKAMHDAEKILMDEMPVAPIYFYVRMRLVNPKVKGWYDPLTSNTNLREAYIE